MSGERMRRWVPAVLVSLLLLLGAGRVFDGTSASSPGVHPLTSTVAAAPATGAAGAAEHGRHQPRLGEHRQADKAPLRAADPKGTSIAAGLPVWWRGPHRASSRTPSGDRPARGGRAPPISVLSASA
ncbi:hypothetical protein GCM10023196_039660 [Actinoallomurus vinaceus]|uniref:Secreted protein n=1 Tax=Actinoallomurus vinaceus TaxID=1080074 RepID=A0ABP8UA17_9ACTN